MAPGACPGLRVKAQVTESHLMTGLGKSCHLLVNISYSPRLPYPHSLTWTHLMSVGSKEASTNGPISQEAFPATGPGPVAAPSKYVWERGRRVWYL